VYLAGIGKREAAVGYRTARSVVERRVSFHLMPRLPSPLDRVGEERAERLDGFGLRLIDDRLPSRLRS
jgi:hypothetical protein